jgi:hypothetical protein
MLTVPIDVIADMLDKAADVEITVFELEDTATGDDAEDATALAEVDLANDPSYRALADMIAAMSADEQHQLLTLAQLGDEEAEASTWEQAAAVASAIPAEDRVGELLRAFVLTDAIEAALEQLGHEFEDEEDEEDGEGGPDDAAAAP